MQTDSRVRTGPPTGECPACLIRYRMVPTNRPMLDGRAESLWQLPDHKGDGRGDWGRCWGVAGDNGLMEAEDIR